MNKNKKINYVFIFFLLVYLILFCFFYYKYVPLVKSFQMILVPILFIVLLFTSINIQWGILIFVFAFPLINNLSYFFGIDISIPHAPTALVLFLSFFLGWLIHQSFSYSNFRLNHPIFRPLILFSLVIFVSGAITFFRYANFFPLLSDNIHELIVNTRGVRSGGAFMSDVFNFLNYLTGFIFFFVLFNTIKSKEFLKRLLIVLSFAILISLLFSLVQRYYSISLGNTQFWVKFERINSTFKDPNSFAIYLCAFIPLVLGMTISFRKQLKLFFLFLIIFALFVFPALGSRSAFLGLGVSGITFFLLFLISERKNIKKKIIYGISSILIVTLIFLSFLFFSKQSVLYKRISWSLGIFSDKEIMNIVSSQKIDLWTVAFCMVKDYPLTGVGLGGFIVELPNYGELKKLVFGDYTDSAENYFFQVGSELGLIGLFLMFWLLFEIIKQMWRSCREFPVNNRDKFILFGAVSGIVSIFVNFFFHSYIGSFEVKYFFWFLVALVFFFSQDKAKSSPYQNFNYKFKIIAAVLLVLFGTVHLWNSVHNLSIKNRTEKFGWNQNYGLYKLEKDDRGFFFHWTRKSSGISIENVGQVLIIPMMASHPNISKIPVNVKIFLANHYFRKRKLIKEIVIKDNSWVDFEYLIPESTEKKIYLVFETNRTWQPLKYLGVPDPRWLAIALGEAWFKYPDELSEEKIKDIQTISYENWGGKHKDKLWSNDISDIKFSINQKNVALRLHVRGQKAFDLGPYIIIRLDDRIIGRAVLTENDWITLVFTPEISEGEHVFSVEFTNDFYKPELGLDKSVFLGDLEIIYIQ